MEDFGAFIYGCLAAASHFSGNPNSPIRKHERELEKEKEVRAEVSRESELYARMRKLRNDEMEEYLRSKGY